MFRSSNRLFYIIRTNPLLRRSSSSSSSSPLLPLFSSKRFDSAKPFLYSHRITSLPISTTGAKLSRSEHSMATSSEPKSVYDFTVKVRFLSFWNLLFICSISLIYLWNWSSEFNFVFQIFEFLWLYRNFLFCWWDLGSDFEEFEFELSQDAKGNDVDLSIYKGKVLLIVNVASQW